MRGNQRDALRAGVAQRPHSFANRAGGVDHVIDDDAIASLDLADDAVRDRVVRARSVAGLVDEREW